MTFLEILLMATTSFAALPVQRNSDYIAPTETMSALRGRVTICTSPRPQGGRGGLSFIQTGQGECPTEPRTSVGWDRPEYEADSPGIPFKNKGLE